MQLVMGALRQEREADHIVSGKPTLGFFCNIQNFRIQQLGGEEGILGIILHFDDITTLSKS